MAMHAIFSAQQQYALRKLHGSPDIDYAMVGGRYEAVRSRRVESFAVVYETEDGEGAVVCTSLADPDRMPPLRDIVDLGPVGKCLGMFRGNGPVPAPTVPMLVPRDRASDLLGGKLDATEAGAAHEAAMELAGRLAAPTPGM